VSVRTQLVAQVDISWNQATVISFRYARSYCTSWEVREYWRNGKDEECTTHQETVAVQGSPCAPTPLILTQTPLSGCGLTLNVTFSSTTPTPSSRALHSSVTDSPSPCSGSDFLLAQRIRTCISTQTGNPKRSNGILYEARRFVATLTQSRSSVTSVHFKPAQPVY
jgi:hypothetical protein